MLSPNKTRIVATIGSRAGIEVAFCVRTGGRAGSEALAATLTATTTTTATAT